MIGANRLFLAAAAACVLFLAGWWLRPHGQGAHSDPTPRALGASGPPVEGGAALPRVPKATGGKPASPAVLPSPTEGNDHIALFGVVRSDAQNTLSTGIPARITAVNVKEGDTVSRGQTLIRLDDTAHRSQARTAQASVDAALAQRKKALAGRDAQRVRAEADVSAARSGLEQARNKLQQAALARDAARDDSRAERAAAVEGVGKAQIALDRAHDTLRGLEALDRVGGVSRIDLEGARSQVKIAESDLTSARAQVARLDAGAPGTPYRVGIADKDVEAANQAVRQAGQGVDLALKAQRDSLNVADQDVAAADAAIRQAQAGVMGAADEWRQANLIAAIDGIATAVNARAGDTAQPGAPLVTVVSLSGLRVEALVPARLLSRLHVGQTAQVAVDTMPGRTFPANLNEIARIAEPDGRTFRVLFTLHAQPALRPGQNAQVVVSTR